MAQQNLVERAVEEIGAIRENLLPILQYIVNEEGYLSEERCIEVAEKLDMSTAEIYGVATFYSFLETKPLGKNIIRVCKTIICSMKGQDSIVDAIEKRLNIKLGETTEDGKFSFMATNCIGQCNHAPAMLVNGKAYINLTPEKAVEVIEEYM